MNITDVLIIAVSACIFTVILNQHRPEFSLLIRLASVLLIIISVFSSFSDTLQATLSLSDELKINSEYILVLIKTLIIAIACRIVSDLCTDTGNKAIAACVELVGQIAIMLLSLPMLKSLAHFAKELVNQ